MQVTSYQMHHVLNCFCKKLGRAEQGANHPGRAGEKRSGDEVSLSPDAVREAALEKITQEILLKIADAGSPETAAPAGGAPAADGRAAGSAETPGTRFTYDVIDSARPKRRATLTGGDARSLIRRLAQLESPEPAAKTDSWI
jgi:hypothetical protein